MGYSDWSPCPPEQCSNSTVDYVFSDHENLLFNLANDPTEHVNLVESEPNIAEDLRIELEEYIVSLPDDL